jgi:tetratricopeptide (TPR) repeat protein
MLQQPVLFLLTWPLRLLPAGWIPVGLNVLAAACASVTLGLLARSVALLPQESLPERQSVPANDQPRSPAFRSAWMPVVLAALALGLQLTFWENATTSPGEMVDLLLFAAVVWCVLEYRSDPRLYWLDRASFICGVALANSWAIAAFLPLVAAALIWSTRLRFFNVRFLQHIEASAWKKAIPALASDGRFFLRMALFGLAGLSLILLLPLLSGLSPDSPRSFWQALEEVARSYTVILHLLARVFRAHKEVTFVLGAVVLAPLLVMSVAWRLFPARQEKNRFDPVFLIYWASHAFLLVLCLSITFDPPFSPRGLSTRLGVPLPFLPLCFLNALSLGYYSSFILRLSTRYASRRRVLLRALRWTAPKLAYALMGLMLIGLLGMNLPAVRVANGRQLEQYAGFIAGSLPPEGAVVFSADSTRLELLQAALDRQGKAGRYVAVDANAIPSERYRAWLKRTYPKHWTQEAVPPISGALAGPGTSDSLLDMAGVLRLMAELARSNRVCWLEANYGPLTELFYLQPRGLIYELKPYAPDAFSGPALAATELPELETFWKRVIEAGVDPVAKLLRDAEKPAPGLAASLMKQAHLTRQLPGIIRNVAHWYSGALNGWGVLLQRQDQPQAATPCFAKAVDLNPDNLPARVNLKCNTNRLAGKELTLASPESLKEQLEKYRGNWAQVLAADGPLDDPTYCYWLSVVCAQNNLRRLAGQELERAHALAPNEFYPRLDLARLETACGMPDRALAMVAETRAVPKLQSLDPKLRVELDFAEARAWLAKTNEAKAEQILLSLLDVDPADSAMRDRVKMAFVAIGSYTNVLRMTDQELQLSPDNVQALVQKGLLCMRLGDFSNAIPLFSRALTLTNSYPVWLWRANAHVQIGELDEATDAYQQALRAFPASSDPYDGLAEVAWRRGDTNSANGYHLQGISNRLLLVREQLQREPDNIPALMEKGALHLRASEFSNAIPAFTRVLSLTNSYPGRLNRALAYLQTGQCDAAEDDYRKMLRLFPLAYQPYYGLAEVALRRGNTNAAIQQYQQYLSKAPTNQVEFQQVAARLKLLQPQAP